MEPAPAASYQEAEDIDLSRVFSFRHGDGEVRSGNALDIQMRCKGVANLALSEIVALAEFNDMGMQIMEEADQTSPDDEAEVLTSEVAKEEPAEQKTIETESQQPVQMNADEKSESASLSVRASDQNLETNPAATPDSGEPSTPNTISGIIPDTLTTENIGSHELDSSVSGPSTTLSEQATDMKAGHAGGETATVGFEPTAGPESGSSASPAHERKETVDIEVAAEDKSEDDRHIIEKAVPTAEISRQDKAFEPELPLPAEVIRPSKDDSRAETPGPKDESANDMAYDTPGELDNDIRFGIEAEESEPPSAISEFILEAESEEFSAAVEEAFTLPLPPETLEMAPAFDSPETATTDTMEGASGEQASLADDLENLITAIEQNVIELEEEAATEVFEIMDRIVELSESLMSTPEETLEVRSNPTEVVEVNISHETAESVESTEEKLEEMVVELLEYLQMEHTPETLASLVKAIRLNVPLKENLQSQEIVEDNKSKDRGTHEFIVQILSSVTKLNKALAYASLIGRSILSLMQPRLEQA